MVRWVVAAAVLCASSLQAAGLTRGPYLQLAGPTAITIAFHSDVAAVGRVRFGPAPSSLTSSVADSAPTTTHALRLTGLSPATRYFYAVELDGQVVAGGADFRFRTYPPPGADEPFRLFAWGDSGNGTAAQLAVADRMATQVGDATLSLILGDIIYDNGEPELYDPRYFAPYAALLRRMVVWPTIGNHDVGLDPTGGPYLDAFHLPTNNPLGTELYYSFDYGDAHFVCLETHVSGHSAGSMQLQWAAADLAASRAKWKFVYFHVPPYSGGTHSDNAVVRDQVLPVLEAAGVDVVFSGHSHVYERSYLLKASAVVQGDASSYLKPTPGTGTLYVVSGTAGQSGALSNPAHPLMAFQVGAVLGTTVVDVAGDTLRGYFLEADGGVRDLFQLAKGGDARPPRLLGVRANGPFEVELSFDEPVQAGFAPGGAERVPSYAISPPLSVLSATLGADLRTVTLATQAHPPGWYTLAVTGVRDRASPANAVAAGTAGAYAVTSAVELLPPAGPWRYLVGAAAPPSDWAVRGFDDAAWAVGPQPLGYGEPGLGTPVAMGTAVTLYTRAHLTRPTTGDELEGLALELDYDDGFVAYLNGVEVARRHLPASQGFDTLSQASHERGVPERFEVAHAGALLLPGDNVLAVEVHNVDGASSDLYLAARLTARFTPAFDAGAPQLDAGVADGGADAGAPADGGAPGVDAGDADAGQGAPDAGLPGPADAGVGDAGVAPGPAPQGCGCTGAPGGLLLLALVGLGRRRQVA